MRMEDSNRGVRGRTETRMPMEEEDRLEQIKTRLRGGGMRQQEEEVEDLEEERVRHEEEEEEAGAAPGMRARLSNAR